MIFLIFLVGILLCYGVSKLQIVKIKINKFVLFIWLIVIIYLTLIFSSPYILFFLLLSLIVLKLFVESKMWGVMIKYSVYVSVFIFLFNVLLNTNGETVIFQWNFIKISLESMAFSISMIFRLIIIMGAFAIFNSNVEMEDMIDILEKLKFPPKSIMTTSISLRFFPIMLKEAREITDVFRIRGIPVYSGKLRDKVSSRYPMMASMLNLSLDRAIQIGEALETKGFPSPTRRSWKKLEVGLWGKISILLLIFSAIISSFYIVVCGSFKFYPTIQPFSTSALYMGILMLMLSLSVLLGGLEKYD